MSLEPLKPPLIIFLIGTTGDLARAKILKAIYKLHTDGLLPENFTLLGNSRKDLTDQTYRDFCHEVIQPSDTDAWNTFAHNVFYVSGDAANSQTLAEINTRYMELSLQTGRRSVLVL